MPQSDNVSVPARDSHRMNMAYINVFKMAAQYAVRGVHSDPIDSFTIKEQNSMVPSSRIMPAHNADYHGLSQKPVIF